MSFEDLVVWKRACRLCVNVYRHLKECTDLGFKDQITRSALSIPCNIAEGYERNTNKDAIKFFYTSRGHVCGFYGNAILFGSKARKQAHSKLCNCFRNAATGQKSASAYQQMWPCEVYYAKGSAGELRTQIYIGMEIGCIHKQTGSSWL